MTIYFLNPYGSIDSNSIATVINLCYELLPNYDRKVISYNFEKEPLSPLHVELFNQNKFTLRCITKIFSIIPYRIKRNIISSNLPTARLDFILFNYFVKSYLKNNLALGDIIILHGNPVFLNNLNKFRPLAKVIYHNHTASLSMFINSIGIEEIMQMSDGIILLNNKSFIEILKRGYNNTWLINNCIQEVLPIPSHDNTSEINFIYSGRLVREKFIREICIAFVNALGNKKQCNLYITGEFSEQAYKEEVSLITKSYRNVLFTNKLKRQDLFDLLKTTKYLILLSESEGSPLSLLEGIQFNNTIISSKIPGCEEIVYAFGGYLIDNENKLSSLTSVLKNVISPQYDLLYIEPNEQLQNEFSKNKYQFKLINVIDYISQSCADSLE